MNRLKRGDLIQLSAGKLWMAIGSYDSVKVRSGSILLVMSVIISRDEICVSYGGCTFNLSYSSVKQSKHYKMYIRRNNEE